MLCRASFIVCTAASALVYLACVGNCLRAAELSTHATGFSEFEQSQPTRRPANPLQALTMLFLALNPVATWQIPGAALSRHCMLRKGSGIFGRRCSPQLWHGLARSPSRAAVPRMDAFDWQSNGGSRLNLLPFGISDILFPGETKQVHLFEARFLKVFEEAEKNDNKCVGQLLVTPGGSVPQVTGLLEIEESKRQDIGVWARLRCVGRVAISGIEATDYGYFRANVSLVTDNTTEAVDQELISECRDAHERCRGLFMKLAKLRPQLLEESDLDEEDEQLWGHESSEQIELNKELSKVCKDRRDRLCWRGLDAAPAKGLDAQMQRLWGASSETEAEDQLLSFSAASFLPLKERVLALQVRNTTERLKVIIKSLDDRSKELGAQLALANLGSSISEE